MSDMSNMSDKKLHTLRYLSYWLYVLCTIGIPIILVSWQYDIFKKIGSLQLTAYGIILVIIVLFIFKGHLKRAIEEMETSVIKTVLLNISKLLPWLVCWLIITFLSDTMARVRFIIFWSVLGNFGAMFIDIWHTTLYQECKSRKRGK